MPALTALAFDADDTLWHNERFFRMTQAHFAELLADYAPKAHLMDHLVAAERRNLGHYGFGIKGFVLSMIETALDLTDDRVPARVIREIVAAGQEMLRHPIELLPHAKDVIERYAGTHRLLLVTKGDLLDQERKLAQSGLGDLFDAVEIVSDKTAQTYAGIFARHKLDPVRTMMIGNSLKSDVLPALDAGAWATHVPHDLTWSYEIADAPTGHARFHAIATLAELPAIIDEVGSIPA